MSGPFPSLDMHSHSLTPQSDVVQVVQEVKQLQQYVQTVVRTIEQNSFEPITAGLLPQTPAGYERVWMKESTGELYSENINYLPPVPADLVYIDTLAIADAAIETNKLNDGAVVTTKIADAAIVTAKIGDLQVVTAKINDLAVNTAKLGSLAVTTAKINDLAVTTGKFADLSVTTAKIDDLAVQTAKIDALAVTTAKIEALAVTAAKIALLAVGSAQIADLAVITAKIADAAITNAKIASLVVDKITSGRLDAEIEVGAGIFSFNVGSSILFIGNGFGDSDQFFIWFGPSAGITTPAACTEATGTVYLKTNGDAYFGGTLAAGVLKNAIQTTDSSGTATVSTGDFSSNGNAIAIVTSYTYSRNQTADAGTGSITGSGGATITVEGSTNSGGAWSTLATYTAVETLRVVDVYGDPGVDDVMRWAMAASGSTSWTPGVSTTLRLRVSVSSRSIPTFIGTGLGTAVVAQTTGVIGTEQ